MAQQSRSDLKSDIDSNLPDNTTQEISPADHRGELKDVVDSHLNRQESDSITGQPEFAPGSAQAPFTLNTNAQGQVVTGLNADQLDGQDASAFGSALALDLGNDGTDESSDLAEIATTGDTNSIVTEGAADKLLMDMGKNWPRADELAASFVSTGLSGGGATALTLDESVIKDGNAKEIDAAELAAGQGTANQFLQSDGAAASWATPSSSDLSDFDEAAQDAVGNNFDASLSYDDATPQFGVATDGIGTDELDQSASYTFSSQIGFDGGLDIEGNWVIDSQDESTVERLRIQGVGVDDPAELFLQAKGTSNVARYTATPDSSTSNFSGVTLESNGSSQIIDSITEGTATALPLDLRMTGTTLIQLTTGNAVQFSNITGTPTMASHDHSEGGMTTVPNAGLTNSSVTITTGNGLSTNGDGTVALGETETYSVDPDTGILTSASGVALDESVLKDGGAKELDVADLAGGLGTAGQVVTTDGAAVTWGAVGSAGIGTDAVGNDELNNADAFTFNGDMTLGQATQSYVLSGAGSSLTLRGQSANTLAEFALEAQTADGGDDVFYRTYAVGTEDATDVEMLEVGYDAGGTRFEVEARNAGTGSPRAIHLFSNANTNQLVAGTSGNVNMETGTLGVNTGVGSQDTSFDLHVGANGGRFDGVGRFGANSPTNGVFGITVASDFPRLRFDATEDSLDAKIWELVGGIDGNKGNLMIRSMKDAGSVGERFIEFRREGSATASSVNIPNSGMGIGVGEDTTPSFHLQQSGGNYAHLGAPASSPTTADMDNGSVIFWLDETNDDLEVAAKKGDGTVLTGTVTLS